MPLSKTLRPEPRRPVLVRSTEPVANGPVDPARVREPLRFVPERAGDPDRESGPASVLVPGSEMHRGVPRAGQPGLGVVALGDDSGEAPADASQGTRYALRHVVVHRSSSVSGHLFAGHFESRRKARLGASEVIPILPAEIGLIRAWNRLTPGLACLSRLSVP